jgi:hypothetical protein
VHLNYVLLFITINICDIDRKEKWLNPKFSKYTAADAGHVRAARDRRRCFGVDRTRAYCVTRKNQVSHGGLTIMLPPGPVSFSSRTRLVVKFVRLDSLHNFQLLDPFFFRNFGITTYCGHWSVPSGVWRGHGLGDVPVSTWGCEPCGPKRKQRG